ncbi:nuclear transport factor 2 family protein [Devosia sp.]|uniref:nuclear transport factor 2 family protein n=1 Tax=Devosia sp. TaxID=1871048 RepID=UPI0032641D79
MTQSGMPEIVERLAATINAGDTDGFLALFPSNGIVEDWGRRFEGHDAIRGWSDKELIGAKGVLTLGRIIDQSGNRTSLYTDWVSSFFSGSSVFTFTLDGDLIREMVISAG